MDSRDQIWQTECLKLWVEVRNTAQEVVTETNPKKKKFKKPKQFSEEALQKAEKIKDTKGKGEKERYTHLNAEFQRIARKDKKAFISYQCKEQRKAIEW